jgi:high-affinity nickel-transport protein
LFTAGMSLVDTTDGILMVGAYGWAFIKPVRKLYYNLTMTFLSVLVAVLVGGAEVLMLAVSDFQLKGAGWDWVAALGDHFGAIGFIIIGIFGLCWFVSVLIYRVRGYDRLDITAG